MTAVEILGWFFALPFIVVLWSWLAWDPTEPGVIALVLFAFRRRARRKARQQASWPARVKESADPIAFIRGDHLPTLTPDLRQFVEGQRNQRRPVPIQRRLGLPASKVTPS